MAYVVTGPCALVKDRAGKIHYYYAGAVIPPEVESKQLDRLVDRGLVSKVDDPAAAVTDAELSVRLSQSESEQAPERPRQVASKAAWVDYAVARGMPREQAEAMDKQEIIDRYPAAG